MSGVDMENSYVREFMREYLEPDERSIFSVLATQGAISGQLLWRQLQDLSSCSCLADLQWALCRLGLKIDQHCKTLTLKRRPVSEDLHWSLERNTLFLRALTQDLSEKLIESTPLIGGHLPPVARFNFEYSVRKNGVCAPLPDWDVEAAICRLNAGVDPGLEIKQGQISVFKMQVARSFGFTRAQLEGCQRAPSLCYARWVAMYLIRCGAGLSYPHIARFFGDRDHTTVMYGVRKIEKMMAAKRAEATSKEVVA